MTEVPVDRRVTTAVQLLTRVFAPVDTPIDFRLWEGTTAHVGGHGESGFAIVFRSRPVFRGLLRHPTPLRFGEAFIGGEIDIEGDLFAAMRAASDIEALRVPLATRLAILVASLRL